MQGDEHLQTPNETTTTLVKGQIISIEYAEDTEDVPIRPRFWHIDETLEDTNAKLDNFGARCLDLDRSVPITFGQALTEASDLALACKTSQEN